MQIPKCDPYIAAVAKILVDAREATEREMDDRAAVYIRVCQPEELVSDLLSEAAAHGCILAVKGEVRLIMPTLEQGWEKVTGGWWLQ
jgi:hypothetical protein